jgi:hypothetical protein
VSTSAIVPMLPTSRKPPSSEARSASANAMPSRTSIVFAQTTSPAQSSRATSRAPLRPRPDCTDLLVATTAPPSRTAARASTDSVPSPSRRTLHSSSPLRPSLRIHGSSRSAPNDRVLPPTSSSPPGVSAMEPALSPRGPPYAFAQGPDGSVRAEGQSAGEGAPQAARQTAAAGTRRPSKGGMPAISPRVPRDSLARAKETARKSCRTSREVSPRPGRRATWETAGGRRRPRRRRGPAGGSSPAWAGARRPGSPAAGSPCTPARPRRSPAPPAAG